MKLYPPHPPLDAMFARPWSPPWVQCSPAPGKSIFARCAVFSAPRFYSACRVPRQQSTSESHARRHDTLCGLVRIMGGAPRKALVAVAGPGANQRASMEC
eukprot:3826606-Prymnesium_polylepis.1